MQHYRSLDDLNLQGAYVAVGSFDGVHRGHRALLESMAAEAHRAGLLAVVVTFFPHPVVLLRNLQSAYYLTSPDERAELLGQAGMDAVVTLPFNHALAGLSARQFAALLTQALGMRSLWAGPDFALGRNREGDLPTLSRLGEAMGFMVRRMEPVVLEGGQVSSSQVRALLGEGRVADAARQLGRFYSVEGPVVHGDGRGSKIGFPTANLDLWEHKLLPANGVYACWAIVEGKRHPAVTNVGVRPTFGNHAPLRVETHLPGAASDLYSKTMRLEFVEQLRSELRFASVQELIDQIHADIRKALEVLARDPQT